jgi:magnesium chelatase subunit D
VIGAKLDVVASLTHSSRNGGGATLEREHLVFRKSSPAAGVRFIFVVDASGSHAAQQRMRAVKGAVGALLESSVDQKDEVAVISFRGAKAEVALPPCRDRKAALRVLEFLPTGGRTPLAHALGLANSLVNSASIVVLLTDGRANVALNSGDPWADALDAAGRLRCSTVLVDSSLHPSTADATNALATAMRAKVVSLDGMGDGALVSALREV